MVVVTVLELLKQKLPLEYVVAIIENMEDKVMLDEESDGKLLNELEDLFDWTISNEGYSFWAALYDAIQEGTPLPKLPFRAKWKPNTYICLEHGSFIVNVNGTDTDITVDVDMSEKPTNRSAKFFREQHLAFVN